MRTYQEWLTESEDFETELIYKCSEIDLQDEVFHNGRWQNVYQVDPEMITIGVPGNLQQIKQSDLEARNMAIMVKRKKV